MAARKPRAKICASRLFQSVLVVLLSIVVLLFPAGSWGQDTRKLIKKVDPAYPELARKMNLTGTVKVELTIAANGNVIQVHILGGNPVFVAAVEEAVKQWKYATAPEETKKTLEFKF